MFNIDIKSNYVGWRVRPPPFVPETEERAALECLLSTPSASASSTDHSIFSDDGTDDDSLQPPTSPPPPPPPPPPPLWSCTPRQHLIRVERAVWRASRRELPQPFVFLEVQEARNVTAEALSRWSNDRVRLVGAIEHDLVPWLVSIGTSGEPSRVALDLSVIAIEPPFCRLIEVFGTLSVDSETGIPQVQVMFFRKLQREYLKRYYKALDAQKPFVPLFIKKLDRDRRRLELDCDSSEELDVEAALLHPYLKKFSSIEDALDVV